MNEESKKILEILNGMDESMQQKIVLECAAKIGTNEWKEGVKDLWQRMENLTKDKK